MRAGARAGRGGSREGRGGAGGTGEGRGGRRGGKGPGPRPLSDHNLTAGELTASQNDGPPWGALQGLSWLFV
jgi:hypothetical protein